jgi:hypothetical protein
LLFLRFRAGQIYKKKSKYHHVLVRILSFSVQSRPTASNFERKNQLKTENHMFTLEKFDSEIVEDIIKRDEAGEKLCKEFIYISFFKSF